MHGTAGGTRTAPALPARPQAPTAVTTAAALRAEGVIFVTHTPPVGIRPLNHVPDRVVCERIHMPQRVYLLNQTVEDVVFVGRPRRIRTR
jgi:hypothetical protein